MGLVNYYWWHINQLAEISAPLTELMKTNTAWQWNNREQNAFEKIKKLITLAPVLRVADSSRSFIINTDASEHLISGVLSQIFDGYEHPIAYASRKLTKVEKRNLTVPEKETAAVHYCLTHWRHYLHNGKQHIVRTDNQALSFFNTKQQLTRKQMTWQNDLAEFDFKFEFRQGKDNEVADALS